MDNRYFGLGLYPVIGWKIGKETVFLTEAVSQTAGSLIEWAIDCGFFKTPQQSEQLASSVKDTNGCYFVPGLVFLLLPIFLQLNSFFFCFVSAFKGLVHPYHDDSARGVLVGLNRTCRNEHIVRAMLEGLCYNIKDLVTTIEEDIPIPIKYIKVDGGVSQNNFVMQFAADILNKSLIRGKKKQKT